MWTYCNENPFQKLLFRVLCFSRTVFYALLPPKHRVLRPHSLIILSLRLPYLATGQWPLHPILLRTVRDRRRGCPCWFTARDGGGGNAGVAGNKLRVCEVDDANQHSRCFPNVSGDIAGDAMVIDLCNEKVSVSRVSDGKHADIVISSGSQDTPMRIRVDQWTERDRLWMILKRYTYQSFVIHCMTRIPRARRAEIHAATLMIKGHNSETEQRFLFAMSPKHSAGTRISISKSQC